MKRVALLGSTGSIGTSTLQVIRDNRAKFSIDLLVAAKNATGLVEQIKEFRPLVAGLSEPTAFCALCELLGVTPDFPTWNGTRLVCGSDEIVAAVRESRAELVVAAVVGMAGLGGVLAALESGKDVALANKESLVVAGSLVVERAAASNARLIPVDSEHSAIFQVLQGIAPGDLSSVILTASGGPFLRTPSKDFATITPEQALRHPKWSMGAKISIDSATLMNKALEVIEARWLFNLNPDQIEVIVHPQSIIHSMIRLRDETVLAQLSQPDMCGPIGYALSYPDVRLQGVMERLDFAKVGMLSFEEVDYLRFPSIQRALECLNGAKGAAAVFNAANEVAVAEFLNCKMPFASIFKVIDLALERFGSSSYESFDDLNELCVSVTEWTRQRVITGPK